MRYHGVGVRRLFALAMLALLFLYGDVASSADHLRFAYPAKGPNYLPITMGRDKGIIQSEGIDLQMK